jgi:hypothetical protein
MGAYVVYKDRKYLIAIKKILTYSAWSVLVVVLFNLIARVIR